MRKRNTTRANKNDSKVRAVITPLSGGRKNMVDIKQIGFLMKRIVSSVM